MSDHSEILAVHQAPSGKTRPDGAGPIELTILMPCLNEAETIQVCVEKALIFLSEYNVIGEVLIADNGSTDGSQDIATLAGARVIPVPIRGYGAALIAGINAARGRFVIMGDADDSYEFRNLGPFVDALRNGADLVMGNRFKGGIAAGAMPPLHRYLGNPVLSFIGRQFFDIPIGDFHCGLRGFARDSIKRLNLSTTGMEFASEMVVRAALVKLRIEEVPTTLKPDGRSRAPHLRTWRDGWRHLRFLLIYSPRWLYLYPGLVLILVGMITSVTLLPGRLNLTDTVSLDIHTFLVACACIQIGTQAIVFGLLARRYSTLHGLLPRSDRYGSVLDWLSLERLLQIALLLALPGAGGLIWAVYSWGAVDFGPLQYNAVLRVMILSLTGIGCALELALSAFLLGIMETPRRPVD